MPFPPDMIVPWVKHQTQDRACLTCTLKLIPLIAIQPDGSVYEKQGRYSIDPIEKYNLCNKVPA